MCRAIDQNSQANESAAQFSAEKSKSRFLEFFRRGSSNSAIKRENSGANSESLKSGDCVSVIRSSGELESGWIIDRVDSGNWIVRSKAPDGTPIEEPILVVKLIAIN